MAIRLFEQTAHASIYRKFRPSYPRKLLELLTDYIKAHAGSFDVAVDVACGSGQSTFYLQHTFKRCIGVDISEAQVKEAEAACKENGAKNVSFLVGSADKIPMDDSLLDAVTIAQAWHWVEPSGFYKECERVLKPGGCVAVYGYGQGHLLNEKCDHLLQHFYSRTLQDYWHDRRKHINNEYKEVILPFRNAKRYDFSMTKTLPLESYFGYVSTWSAYWKYCEAHPGNSVLHELKEKMKVILSDEEESEENEVHVRFPVFLLLAQK